MAEATAGQHPNLSRLSPTVMATCVWQKLFKRAMCGRGSASHRLISTTALRRGASEIRISPAKGLSSSRIR